jgi:hypothetical protein
VKKKVRKIIFAVFLGALVVSISGSVAFAQSDEVKLPGCHNCKTIEVTPGDPLTAAGTGSANASGEGLTHYNIQKGSVSIKMNGILAYHVSDNDEIRTSGWIGRTKFGGWVFLWGEGKIKIKGDNFQTLSLGDQDQRARGTGAATWNGEWSVTICTLKRVDPRPVPDILSKAPAAALVE